MRRFLLRLLTPLANFIAGTHFRLGEPKLHYADYQMVLSILRPGDIILSREAWRITNLFIPGKLKHAAVFVGKRGGDRDALVEATYPKARWSNVVAIWQMASRVVILRPRFEDAAGRSDAAVMAGKLVGTPYDTSFGEGEEAMYCSELVDAAYFGEFEVLRRDVMGFEGVIVPDDLRTATGMNRVVWDSVKA